MPEEMMQWTIRENREPVEIGTIVMNGWELKRFLGKGGSGSVWMAEKSAVGITAQSAIKIINIPNEPSDLDNMRSNGLSQEEIKAELRGRVETAIREIQVMLKLKEQ